MIGNTEGTFKGWTKEKEYGFIQVDDDNSHDVIVFKNEVSDLQKTLARGTSLTFTTQETKTKAGTRKKACNVQVVKQEPVGKICRGLVTNWIEKDCYGWITPEDGSADLRVYASELPVNESGQLSKGLLVDYYKNRKAACSVKVVGFAKTDNSLTNFADMGKSDWLLALKLMAEKEQWDFKQVDDQYSSLPILRNYIRYTFQRLEETDGVKYSDNGKYAAFNTGLVTPYQDEIYALFQGHQQKMRQKWQFSGFKKMTDRNFMDNFGSDKLTPPLASYFEGNSDLLFDRSFELKLDIEHILDNIDRFPKELQDDKFRARQSIVSAEMNTKKRVARNYKAAIPQFFRDKGKGGCIQLLLPICLVSPDKVDMALVAEKFNNSQKYLCKTVLELNWAYSNARLLARPDTEWLGSILSPLNVDD